jgi:outer membrane protein W
MDTTKKTRGFVLLAVISLMLLVAGDAVAVDGASLANRHRIEIGVGYWDSGYRQTVSRSLLGWESSQAENLAVGFSYSYWASDRVAARLAFKVLLAQATSTSEFYYDREEQYVIINSVLLGARFYPFVSLAPFRPYVDVGVGPYIGVDDRKERDFRWESTTTVLGSFGGHVGAGLDIEMGRHVMLGLHTGYNLMVDFEEPLGGEDNFSGVEFSAGISLLI